MISIVLPCLNEIRHGYLPNILDNLALQPGNKQIIIVLSPSTDGTYDVINQHPAARDFKVIEAEAANRAQRLTIGIEASQGSIVLLHHPATLLPPQALGQIETLMADGTVVWGGFRHSFDFDHWLLKFTSWYSTTQRPHASGILYLDHCIFARRQALLDIGGVPDMDIFEDTALSKALGQYGPPRLVAGTIVTSARRFRERGLYRHAALNQLLKLMYYAGLDPKKMNWLYEGKSQINVSYNERKK
ncbi:glycosyltransferase [Leptothoe kymatousa]|uniref:4,4'-diaponeurosporenoate glycosyltransferase n=1 Tax=Leptothoe kymatousa TAU-MAC 1615 TaxID=2364775 RepID=A0ABS5XZU1_9CYAN|nr:glycosyltransferase [Leptothoe kymatousa]MBT9311122.1 glycosyltransferase [Leptothoe kymatousa TAU-MAC 1615]